MRRNPTRWGLPSLEASCLSAESSVPKPLCQPQRFDWTALPSSQQRLDGTQCVPKRLKRQDQSRTASVRNEGGILGLLNLNATTYNDVADVFRRMQNEPRLNHDLPLTPKAPYRCLYRPLRNCQSKMWLARFAAVSAMTSKSGSRTGVWSKRRMPVNWPGLFC